MGSETSKYMRKRIDLEVVSEDAFSPLYAARLLYVRPSAARLAPEALHESRGRARPCSGYA